MVQIHSPRPLLLEPTIYRHTIVGERLVAGQEVKGSSQIRSDHFKCLSCTGLRCICYFKSNDVVCTDVYQTEA